jgi:phosphate starvation-inducible protein PhoH and related proteins
LSEVCGANDRNLLLIEKLLGVRIISKGNELFLEKDDSQKSELLRLIIRELETHAKNGQTPTPELISSIFHGLSTDAAGGIELLKSVSINVPGGYSRVFPRAIRQAVYIQAIQSRDMVFGIGPAGTGKTYLAVACALEEVLARRKRKLILTRPVVEAGESLGFLPGDLTQKLNPYLRPLYDAMEAIVPHEIIVRMEDNGMIEIAPLAYMRGRSLKNCMIILDEAQNTTREQMKMFLTRMGEDSKTVITGDITQIDLPRKNASGLVHAAQILAPIGEIHFSRFTAADVVRNPLVKMIIDAYESEPGA